jgi:hypothetical protein
MGNLSGLEGGAPIGGKRAEAGAQAAQMIERASASGGAYSEARARSMEVNARERSRLANGAVARSSDCAIRLPARFVGGLVQTQPQEARSG